MTFELISAACSVGHRDDRGDDRVRLFGDRGQRAGAVVCDGVGSEPGSDATAERVAELAVSLMYGGDLGSSFLQFDDELERHLGPDDHGATTLVLVRADRDGLVGHFLVGNGAVIEVVPMETGSDQIRLLWSSIALPRMATRDGRPALASFLPQPDRKLESEKGLRKVPADAPRLYLVCSDGLLSEEERLEGDAPDATVWRQVPDLMADLMGLLTDAWTEIVAAETERSAALLQGCLEETVDPQGRTLTLDDDTTVAAVLLRPARPTTNLGPVAP
jgi:Protein phosphatase 2C